MTVKIISHVILILSITFPVVAQVSDNVILKYSTSCIIEKGKNIVEKTYHIQINNRQGEWITDIQIPFKKGNKVESLEAEIRDINGRVIRKLKNSDVLETSHISNISLYEDDYVKKFSLKHNQYPYQIYYKYKIDYSEFLWIETWTPVLNTATPTEAAQLTLQIPKDYSVKISQEKITDFKIDTTKGLILYEWNSSYLDLIKDEIYSPDKAELVPYVHIVPVNFKYGVPGSHETWKSYGDWLDRLSNGLDILPVSEQGKIHHLIKGIEDPKEKVKLLYNYMQDNTRYINVAIDIGGLKPYPAEYVARNKYGDCKALTNYMKALLEIAKIPSYCVDVFADENTGRIVEDFPSQQFNHVVLCVPIDNDTIWLENTSSTDPVGYTSTFIQNRKGLLINGDKSQLIKIPGLGLEEVKEDRFIDYKIDEFGDCVADFSLNGFGPGFEVFNAISQYPQNQQKQILGKYLPFKNFEITTWQICRPDRNVPQAQIRSEIKLKNIVARYDDDFIIKPLALSLPDFETPEVRRLPVRISYPIYSVDSMIFNIPETMSFKKHSEDFYTSASFGSYSIRFVREGNKVKATREFILNSGNYSNEVYSEFYGFVKTVKLAESRNLMVLTQKKL